ncbi:hypothetical protein G2W53_041842 [Senna tora]|uniref:Uncharacterized protein n=1 Tax=Senna tora TaxID=362788 RepID=A0A834W1U1_9FABA|nr:hypothetical protein G2W53_041842 [Senna tora]
MWQIWENPTSANPNSSQKLVASDETIVDAVNGYGAELIDFADKNYEFLSSLYVSRNDFTTSTEMGEENICMKYKKDGTLLVCKTTTCQLMVHENYLGAPAKHDEEVNRYGPEHNNMIDFANKHHEFFISLFVSRTYFTTSTEMEEENICMKFKIDVNGYVAEHNNMNDFAEKTMNS